MGRRIYFDRQKPFLGAQLDRSHWAVPQAAWLFNEGAGGVVNDSVSNAHLTVDAGAIWSTGSVGAGLTAPDNATMCGARTPAPAHLRFQPPFALQWRGVVLGAPSYSSNSPSLVGCSYTNTYRSPYFAYNMCRHSGGQYRVIVDLAESGAYNRVVWENAIIYNVELHFVCVITSTHISLYRNGVLLSTQGRTSPGATLSYGAAPYFAVSTHPSLANNQLYALTDSAGVFPTALTADQIRSLYEAPYQAFYRETPVFYSIPSGGVSYERYCAALLGVSAGAARQLGAGRGAQTDVTLFDAAGRRIDLARAAAAQVSPAATAGRQAGLTRQAAAAIAAAVTASRAYGAVRSAVAHVAAAATASRAYGAARSAAATVAASLTTSRAYAAIRSAAASVAAVAEASRAVALTIEAIAGISVAASAVRGRAAAYVRNRINKLFGRGIGP